MFIGIRTRQDSPDFCSTASTSTTFSLIRAGENHLSARSLNVCSLPASLTALPLPRTHNHEMELTCSSAKCASWRSVFCVRTHFNLILVASPIHNSKSGSASRRNYRRYAILYRHIQFLMVRTTIPPETRVLVRFRVSRSFSQYLPRVTNKAITPWGRTGRTWFGNALAVRSEGLSLDCVNSQVKDPSDRRQP